MDNVLITGGTGFIGRWLCCDPHGLIVQIGQSIYEKMEWKSGDWKYIIHLAPVPVDDVIECAKRCGATVMLASSGGVYDAVPNPYFQMKLGDERKLFSSGLDVRIARIFTTCGAGMKWGRYAIGNFIMQAEAGGPINVQSHGVVVRSYMYGSDLAEWLWAILLRGEKGDIYEVGSFIPHSTQELAHEIASHYDPPPQINIIQKMQYEPRPFYVPDITYSHVELDLYIKVDFEEAVKRTVEDYRNER